jgi:hypothetical protein
MVFVSFSYTYFFRFAGRRIWFHSLHTASFLGRQSSLRSGFRIYWSRFDGWRHFYRRLCCPPLITDFGLGGSGRNSPFRPFSISQTSMVAWVSRMNIFYPISLWIKGIPAYNSDKRLAFRIAFPIHHRPMLRTNPWVLNLLKKFIWTRENFVLRPGSHLDRLEQLRYTRNLQPYPRFQPVIVNDPNEPLTGLLIRAHKYECISLQDLRCGSFPFGVPRNIHPNSSWMWSSSSSVSLSSE